MCPCPIPRARRRTARAPTVDPSRATAPAPRPAGLRARVAASAERYRRRARTPAARTVALELRALCRRSIEDATALPQQHVEPLGVRRDAQDARRAEGEAPRVDGHDARGGNEPRHGARRTGGVEPLVAACDHAFDAVADRRQRRERVDEARFALHEQHRLVAGGEGRSERQDEPEQESGGSHASQDRRWSCRARTIRAKPRARLAAGGARRPALHRARAKRPPPLPEGCREGAAPRRRLRFGARYGRSGRSTSTTSAISTRGASTPSYTLAMLPRRSEAR